MADLADELGGPGSSIVTNLSNAIVAARKLSDPLSDVSDITKKLNKLQQENEVRIIRRKVAEESYAKAIGNATEAAALDTLKKASAELQVNQMLEDQLRKLEGIAEEEKKVTEEKKKQNNLSEFAKKQYGDIVKKLEELTSITAIFKMIVDGANEFNKASVQISKNFGYSAMQADRLSFQLKGIGNATNINFKNLVAAQNQLITATGFVAEYSADALETQIMLTKQLGLSEEEAAGIYKLSVLTGKSSEKVNDEMVGAFVATRNSYKAGVPFQATMAAAAKVSGQLKANLQADPAGIVKAVVATTALGTSLEQTAAQGEKLLNFASSIESELNAELLTGKQLNLERARAAALAGDQVALAEELNKNIGSYEDFTKMNVLQQKALADAVGLTADQLANQLEKQKLAKESGKSLAEITKEEALKAEKRKNTEQKFSDIMDKLKDIVGSVGAALSPFIEGITFILDHSIVVYGLLGAWLARSILIGNSFKGLGNTVKDIAKTLGSKVFGKGASGVGDSITSSRGITLTKKATEGADKVTEKTKGGGISGFLKGIDMKQVLKGAAAILILSAALFVAAKAFQEFASVEWESIAKGGVALLGLVGITKLLGNSIPGIIKGAVAIAILGAALIPLSYALNLAAPGIEAFGKAIKSTFEGIGTIITAAANGIATMFGSLQNVDVMKLLAIGPALIGIGIGLASLGAGGVLGAIGAFLGGDPIEKLQALAASGDGLTQTATALQAIAGALIGVSAALASIDISKLEALDEFSSNQASNAIKNAIAAPIKAIGEVISGGKDKEINPTIDLTPMIVAINEVRTAIDRLYSKDTSINMNGTKVGTTLSQNSRKVA
jgi:hypothetical protein